jgi:lipopolysaccharide/colanic/teichoic acid biosynthesis glycosyltransferase
VLDLRYVREQGLWLDLQILARTVGRLTGRGAN